MKLATRHSGHYCRILTSLYFLIFGYSFEGSGPIIEGDFDPKSHHYCRGVKKRIGSVLILAGAGASPLNTLSNKYLQNAENAQILHRYHKITGIFVYTVSWFDTEYVRKQRNINKHKLQYECISNGKSL